MLDEIRTLGDAEPILDYGTGQAVLLARAIEMGLDCVGCDLDVDVPFSKAPPGSVLRLDYPWAMPNGRWGTVAMLDVIEHHHDPVSFLLHVNARYLILKVPTATGPAAMGARALSRCGHPQLLEQLFLVGENFPHCWLATLKGVVSIAERAGWRMRSHRRLQEFDGDLPDRMRGGPTSPFRRQSLSAAGATLGRASRWWSDTALFVFAR